MRALCFVVVVLALSACISSKYMPHDPPWVATYVEDGVPRYRLGNQSYDSIEGATVIDAEVHRQVVAGKMDMLWGTIIASTGSGVLSLGLTDVLLLGANNASIFGGTSPAIGFVTLGVGLVGIIGGLALVASGERDRIDALNLFNDRMFKRWQSEHGLAPPPQVETLRPDPVLAP